MKQYVSFKHKNIPFWSPSSSKVKHTAVIKTHCLYIKDSSSFLSQQNPKPRSFLPSSSSFYYKPSDQNSYASPSYSILLEIKSLLSLEIESVNPKLSGRVSLYLFHQDKILTLSLVKFQIHHTHHTLALL